MQALKIDQELKSLFATERKITLKILLLIQTLDLAKSYRELGYASLFEYLTKGIGYSEGSAQRRISASRALKQTPKIEEDIKSGDLNLTQISLASTAFRQQEKALGLKVSHEKKEFIFETIKNQSTLETQKILKHEFKHFEMPSNKPRILEDDKISVTLKFSEDDWKSIEALKAHFSHAVPDLKLESLLLHWSKTVETQKQKQVQKYVVQNEERVHKRTIEPQIQKPARKAIPVPIKTLLFERAKNQCEYVSPLTKIRCKSLHFLEVEHTQPLALGGSNDIQNLRIYCRSHNSLAAKNQGVARLF